MEPDRPVYGCARKADSKNPLSETSMANFGIGRKTEPNFPPQLVYSQTLGFVPSFGDTLPSVIPGTDNLPVREDGYELVRVMVFGSNYGINYTIRWLWGLNLA